MDMSKLPLTGDAHTDARITRAARVWARANERQEVWETRTVLSPEWFPNEAVGA